MAKQAKTTDFNPNSEGRSNKPIIITIVILILILIGLIAWFLSRPEGYRIIKMLEIYGDVSLDRGQDKNIKVYDDMNLQAGDNMHTGGDESYCRLVLDEDKYVYVAEKTEVAFELSGTSSNSRTTLNVRSGSVINELESSLKREESYEVKTPNATMAVRGTKFRVSVYVGEDNLEYTRLSTLEGSVVCRLVYPDGSVDKRELTVSTDNETLIYLDRKENKVDYVYFDKYGRILKASDLVSLGLDPAGFSNIRPIDFDSIPQQTLGYIIDRMEQGTTYASINEDTHSRIGDVLEKGSNREPIVGDVPEFPRVNDSGIVNPVNAGDNSDSTGNNSTDIGNDAVNPGNNAADAGTNADIAGNNVADAGLNAGTNHINDNVGFNSLTGGNNYNNNVLLDNLISGLQNLLFPSLYGDDQIRQNDFDQTVTPSQPQSNTGGGGGRDDNDDDDDDDDRPPRESESELQEETESQEEIETLSEEEQESESLIETESETILESESESASDRDPEKESEIESETGTGPESESESESESKGDTDGGGSTPPTSTLEIFYDLPDNSDNYTTINWFNVNVRLVGKSPGSGINYEVLSGVLPQGITINRTTGEIKGFFAEATSGETLVEIGIKDDAGTILARTTVAFPEIKTSTNAAETITLINPDDIKTQFVNETFNGKGLIFEIKTYGGETRRATGDDMLYTAAWGPGAGLYISNDVNGGKFETFKTEGRQSVWAYFLGKFYEIKVNVEAEIDHIEAVTDTNTFKSEYNYRERFDSSGITVILYDVNNNVLENNADFTTSRDDFFLGPDLLEVGIDQEVYIYSHGFTTSVTVSVLPIIDDRSGSTLYLIDMSGDNLAADIRYDLFVEPPSEPYTVNWEIDRVTVPGLSTRDIEVTPGIGNNGIASDVSITSSSNYSDGDEGSIFLKATLSFDNFPDITYDKEIEIQVVYRGGVSSD